MGLVSARKRGKFWQYRFEAASVVVNSGSVAMFSLLFHLKICVNRAK